MISDISDINNCGIRGSFLPQHPGIKVSESTAKRTIKIPRGCPPSALGTRGVGRKVFLIKFEASAANGVIASLVAKLQDRL